MFEFLSQKFSSIFSAFTQKSHVTETDIQATVLEVEQALIQADVPYDIVQSFVADIKTELVGKKIHEALKPGEQFLKIVHDKMVAFLGGQAASAPFTFQIPSVIMVMGLQGSGKTTTVAKLAQYINEQAQERGKKRSILLASVDYYRPAAIDQLATLANQVGASFYRSSETDPVLAARDIHKYFQTHQFELLFLDTAGRLHIDSTMIEQLRTIDTLINPKYKILVLDAMTGQESLRVAQAFDQGAGFGAAILSKMDSSSKAGAAFAFRYALKKPIIFVGSGEKVTDLESFKADRIARRMLGMGDMLSLVEHAEKKIKKEEQEALSRSMTQGKMTLQDFAQQLDMMGKLGSLSTLTKFLPGMGSLKLSPEVLEKGEKEIKKFKAIISSMTSKERFYPKILNPSRKQRIANGAGVMVGDVNLLLTRFEESQQFAKLFKKFGRGTNPFK
jgi:signal recognition particle subunit SRP54